MVEFNVDAIVPDTRLNAWADGYLKRGTFGLANAFLNWMARRGGGLWVGGAVCISDSEIRFTANALNRAVQDGDLTLVIRPVDVQTVSKRFGVLTSIVDVVAGERRSSFRCFRSNALLAAIREAVRAAQKLPPTAP
jgi:hypothetical protein